MRAALALSLVVACTTSIEVPQDSGVDGGLCELVGPWRACEPRCAQGCGEDSICAFELGLCAPAPEDTGMDTCVVDRGDDRSNTYCYSPGLFCASTGSPGSNGERSGVCVPRELCQNTPADIPFQCFYSDGSDFVSGPPSYDGECAGNEEAAFCGGSCGGCEVTFRWPDWQFCVGINDARGVGLCALSTHRCDYRYPIGGLSRYATPERACVLDAADPDVGWVVLRETCLAYRDRFPDTICRDFNWLILP